MDVPGSAEKTSQERPRAVIQLGRFRLTGPWAPVVSLALLALIVALIVHSHPTTRMLLSGGIWILLMVYWSIPAKNAASARRVEASKSSGRHQNLLSLAILLLFIPVPGLTRRFLPLTPPIIAIGLIVQVGCVLFYLWAKQYLGRFWSSAVTIRKDHQLVSSGPYRLLRHPMYTAVLGMFAGTTIVSGQYHALIGFGLAVFAYLRKIRIEEGVLAETFGTDYERHRRNTWALIPWVY
jgi:protein-S-isoprenylcysteine O-methyltransferase Ste14